MEQVRQITAEHIRDISRRTECITSLALAANLINDGSSIDGVRCGDVVADLMQTIQYLSEEIASWGNTQAENMVRNKGQTP